MDFKEMYKSKLTTLEEAVKVVKSGDWIDYGYCVGSPVGLDKALAARYQELEDVKLRGGVEMYVPEELKIAPEESPFWYASSHWSGHMRSKASEGHAFYLPIRFSELPRYTRENFRGKDPDKPIDVLMMMVPPMDKHGWFSTGTQSTHYKALQERSKKIILEVNPNVPYVHGNGEAFIHVRDVDLIVENETVLPELKAGPITEVDMTVAKLIVEEIPNGACIQLGIGGMPNAVGSMIVDSDLKDLGVQTEMYVDSLVDMSLAGKITGAKKQVDRFKQVFSFAAGTRKMYDFLDHNPEMMSAPVDYVNDIRVVSSQENFMSINNTINVDLFGQVASESVGYRHISGQGGQLDFVLGAYLSPGGKSFICCSSAVKGKDGQLQSRIVPTLAPGTIVTATRTNTHYVVTEYGKVNLKGMTTWERAEALISIAHPQFQDQLVKEAEKMNIWRRMNKKF